MSANVNDEFTLIPIADLSGGINIGMPANEIGDNESVDLLNFTFDKTTNLMSRSGVMVSNITPSTFSHRVTSIYQTLFENGNTFIVATAGNDVFFEAGNGTYTSIKGSASLPADVFYNWKMLNDFAIGCNGQVSSSSYANPIKWDGVNNVSQLKDGLNNAPGGKYLEVWNSRLWIVSSDDPNLIYFSKLGDPENYAVGGGSIAINTGDGDIITGMIAHKGFLFVFKRRKVYRVTTGTPNTDPNQWSVENVISNAGCVSQYTIQALLDDVVFLSEAGVMSLNSALIVGDFETALLSKNIPNLTQNVNQLYNPYNQFSSVVNSQESQYWLGFPYSNAQIENSVVWVLDFKRIQEGKLRWSRFDGLIVGTCYASAIVNGTRRVVIGGLETNKKIYIYGDQTILDDDSAAFTKTFISKAYNVGSPLIRKKFSHVGLTVINTNSANNSTVLTFSYRFNESDTLSRSFSFTLTPTLFGSLYDINNWGSATWGDVLSRVFDIIRMVGGSSGKRGKSIQFNVTSSGNGQSFVIQNLQFEVGILKQRRARNI